MCAKAQPGSLAVNYFSTEIDLNTKELESKLDEGLLFMEIAREAYLREFLSEGDEALARSSALLMESIEFILRQKCATARPPSSQIGKLRSHIEQLLRLRASLLRSDNESCAN